MPTDRSNGNGTPTSTKVVTKQVVCRPVGELDPDIISTTKHEEWTTSRKKVNHKTKQVETRVQRQIILEDGKVVADSGPQVTTHTTEDDKTEETENTEHKTSGDDPPEDGYCPIPGSARVVSEKTETRHTMQEKKEENKQLSDETFQDLTGTDFHHLALAAPSGEEQQLPGKMTHYSSRSQKVTDKEEVKEVSQLQDGELRTETTRTHHHEELYDDEVPEDEVDETTLPEVSAETTRKIEYLHNDVDGVAKKHELLKSPDYEEVIRNKETNRWLEDHFGSDHSDPAETSGNVINIQLTSPRRENVRSATEERDVQKKSSFYTDSWTTPRRPLQTASPLKTFYLGENDTYPVDRKLGRREASSQPRPVRRSMSQREPSFRKFPLLEKTRYFSDDSPTVTSQTLPRDWRRQEEREKTTRYIHVELPDEKDRSHSPAFVHHLEKRESNTLPKMTSARVTTPHGLRSFYFGDKNDTTYSPREGDRSLGDSFSPGGHFLSDSFTKSYSTTDRHRFMRDLLDNGGTDVSVGTTDHVPASRKLPPEKRQSQFHTSLSPPPTEFSRPRSPIPPSSPPPRLIPVTRTEYSSTPKTHTADLFSFLNKTTSVGNNLMKTRSESHLGMANPPSFTPLVSPLEILNVANKPAKFVEVKPKKKSPVVVEVRDWESR